MKLCANWGVAVSPSQAPCLTIQGSSHMSQDICLGCQCALRHIGKVWPRLASVTAMTFPIDTRELALRNGRIVRVRPLVWSDRAIYERAVMDLSPRSRYLRFFAPMPRLSERLLDQMTH